MRRRQTFNSPLLYVYVRVCLDSEGKCLVPVDLSVSGGDGDGGGGCEEDGQQVGKVNASRALNSKPNFNIHAIHRLLFDAQISSHRPRRNHHQRDREREGKEGKGREVRGTVNKKCLYMNMISFKVNLIVCVKWEF